MHLFKYLYYIYMCKVCADAQISPSGVTQLKIAKVRSPLNSNRTNNTNDRVSDQYARSAQGL